MNDESEERKILGELRGLLEPPHGLAAKISSAALRIDPGLRPAWVWAALAGAGIVVVAIGFAARNPSVPAATARIENVGSIVVGKNEAGNGWLVASSRRDDRRRIAPKGMILITKGEDR
jgi:hypothetical protein